MVIGMGWPLVEDHHRGPQYFVGNNAAYDDGKGETMTASNDPDWLAKDEAAALLGVAPRTLERQEAKGYIEKRTRPRGPLDRGNEVEYSRVDILALKSGAPNVHAREVELNQVRAPAPESNEPAPSRAVVRRETGPPLVEDHYRGPQYFVSAYPAAPPEPAGKPWLTLPEAVEFSGLPAHFLITKARAGQIRAVNVGTGRKEYWRFNREGLTK